MEKFFTPVCIFRHEEFYDFDGDEPLPFEFTEEQRAVPVEAFLNQSWGRPDFLAFMTASVLPKIVWISENAFLSITNVSPVLQCDQWEECPGSLNAELTTTNGKTECRDLSPCADSSTLSDGQSRIFWHMVMALCESS
jgi:hypothetical protein